MLSAVQESQQQACLLESLQALTWLKQLDQQMPAEPAIVLELLSLAASVLADAGTLGLRHGAYLQDCLHYITKQMPCSGIFSSLVLHGYAAEVAER